MSLHELLELEHRGWRSLCDGTGPEVYAELLGDAAIMVLAPGQALDRAATLASLRDAPPWQRYTIEQPRVVPVGPDAAALVYRGTGAWMTSVYVRRDGGWGLALHQQTPADTTAPPG